MIVLCYGLHDGEEMAFGVSSESKPGHFYDVLVWPSKGTGRCDCDDYVCRLKKQDGSFCKHIRAVYSEGLPLLDLVEYGRQ